MPALKFLNEKTLLPEQLQPTTDKNTPKSKGTASSSEMTIDPYSGAHEKPFLRVYVSSGDDYKTIKPKVAEWLKSIGEHDEWLIVQLEGEWLFFEINRVVSSKRFYEG